MGTFETMFSEVELLEKIQLKLLFLFFPVLFQGQ